MTAYPATRIEFEDLALFAPAFADGTRACCALVAGYAEIDLRNGSIEGIWLTDYSTPHNDRRSIALVERDALYPIVLAAFLRQHAADIREQQEAADVFQPANEAA
jgi:hypothetical protein